MAPTNNIQVGSSTLTGPAGVPPTGTEPNFDDPSNQNGLVRAVVVLVTVITSLFMIMRIYSRIILKRFTLHDALGLAAFALYLAFVEVFIRLLNSYGWFVHMWDLRLQDYPAVNQVLFQGLIIYFCVLLLIKSAILLEWTSIFVPMGTRDAFWWISNLVLAVHVLFYVSMIIVELTACTPFERNWNPLIAGKCLNTVGVAVAISAVNLFFDITIFLLPQRVIWSLNMRTQKKIGISFLFGVGVLACIAAGFRLGASLKFYKSADVTYTFSTLALWCLGEVTCAFIIFCGPAIPKTFSNTELQGLVSNLKSWAGSSVRKLVSSGSSSKDGSSLGTRKRSRSNFSRHDNSLEKTSSPQVPPLPEQYRTRDTGNLPSGDNSDMSPQAGEIVQTTRFTAVEDSSVQNIADDQHSRQHPWMYSQENI